MSVPLIGVALDRAVYNAGMRSLETGERTMEPLSQILTRYETYAQNSTTDAERNWFLGECKMIRRLMIEEAYANKGDK